MYIVQRVSIFHVTTERMSLGLNKRDGCRVHFSDQFGCLGTQQEFGSPDM